MHELTPYGVYAHQALRGHIDKFLSIVIFEGRKQVTTLTVLFLGISILSRF